MTNRRMSTQCLSCVKDTSGHYATMTSRQHLVALAKEQEYSILAGYLSIYGSDASSSYVSRAEVSNTPSLELVLSQSTLTNRHTLDSVHGDKRMVNAYLKSTLVTNMLLDLSKN